MTLRSASLIASTVVLTALVGPLTARSQRATPMESRVDAVFARWSAATPGCAVGVSQNDAPVLAKAYGMADLEHDVPNTPDTIFEAGSVSKQFTAAAVLLLAREGKLSLDDPARKYVPELPDYGHPLTIRHMLNHTSGLRDWGSVAGIGGWPRTSRAYTHAHVLDIVSRQRALNFTPGTRYSYSNSGYNLAAIIVSRVSGHAFADFTRARLFEPAGMTRTSWRDDHQRIVKGRAMSYSESGSSYRTLMPFENVHGNGGLLTTVGDLLKWNANFSTHVVGDAAFVSEQERPGRFNDGRSHGYALGLMVGPYKGVPQVAHSGSTAGYRAQLSRYPSARLSVAVLCNAGNAAATDYANQVADLYLADHLRAAATAATAATHSLTADEMARVAGLYRHAVTGEPMTIARGEAGLRVQQGPALLATGPSRFVTAAGDTVEVGEGTARMTDRYGTADSYVRVPPFTPTPADLAPFAGVYLSDEAEVSLEAVVDGQTLVLKRRPDTALRLTPVYADAFSSPLGTVIFRREGTRVNGLSVVQDRVWDLRFNRRQ